MDLKRALIALIVAIVLVSTLLWTWLDLRLVHSQIPLEHPHAIACPSGDTIQQWQLFSRTRPIAYTITIEPCFKG